MVDGPPKTPLSLGAIMDEATVAAYSDKAKKQLRARMKAVRSGHSPGSLASRSEAIIQRLLGLDSLREARAVALFWPILERGEIDLRPLDITLRQRGLEVYYPFMDPRPGGGFKTGFRRSKDVSQLRDRGRKFFEPEPGPAARAGQVDLVLVPALAADPSGNRIGYGAGYYDATLPDICPPATSIIVVYQFQVLAELPKQPHDKTCDMVVTDEQTYS